MIFFLALFVAEKILYKRVILAHAGTDFSLTKFLKVQKIFEKKSVCLNFTLKQTFFTMILEIRLQYKKCSADSEDYSQTKNDDVMMSHQ